MPALAALSVPTWQSLMTQRLNLAPSRDVVALCAAAATTGVAKPAMPALISIRRVREVSSIDVLLCGWPRGILNAARRRARSSIGVSPFDIGADTGICADLTKFWGDRGLGVACTLDADASAPHQPGITIPSRPTWSPFRNYHARLAPRILSEGAVPCPLRVRRVGPVRCRRPPSGRF